MKSSPSFSLTVLLCLSLLAAADARGVPADVVIGADVAALEALEGVAGPSGADEWFMAQRLGTDQTGDLVSLAGRARSQADRIGRSALAALPAWQSMGPTNLGGRVTDLAVDPSVANTVYAATASGGVWK